MDILSAYGAVLDVFSKQHILESGESVHTGYNTSAVNI